MSGSSQCKSIQECSNESDLYVNVNEHTIVILAILSPCCVGSIDEVSQEITMTWVQPRVLDLTQVSIISYTGFL